MGDMNRIYAWALRSPLKSHSTLTRANSTCSTALSADTVEKERKNLLNRRCCAIKTTAKSMKGQQGWKETKGVRTVSGGQVQQLTQKNSSTPHLKNRKLEEEKSRTVEV